MDFIACYKLFLLYVLESYVDVKYTYKVKTEFFNNCEEKNTWGQTLIITNEQAFSGKYSSKIGVENNFSITLEHPLNRLPDSLKNCIDISLKLFQKSSKHKAVLAIEANGNEFKAFWKGINLKNEKNINEWTDFKTSFHIPDSIKNADVFRVYVHNPSEEAVYIDDFEVKFR